MGPSRAAWARGALAWSEHDVRAVQQRTWNLSTLWRLESRREGTLWLKQVPHFFRHEGALLRWIDSAAPGSVPKLLASDGDGRSVLAHVAGDDLYGAPAAMRQMIAEQLHRIQVAAIDATDDLLALGVPDRRGPLLSDYVRQKLGAHPKLPPSAEPLLRQLSEQLERLHECGLPDTLLHIDNQPGNARGSDRGVALLDWGDAVLGNPAHDLLSLVASLPPAAAAPLIADWCDRWKRRVPRANPERALQLYPFVDALYGAALYAHFLQEIEASERPYHEDDVAQGLTAAEHALPPRGAA